jgi:protein-S-isoprenylcysteine O-methyltransferase Ste14
MSERAGLLIFDLTWVTLIAVALVTQAICHDTRRSKRSVTVTDFLIAIPFVIVFGLFYIGYYVGTYQGNAASRAIGATFALIGLAVYSASHIYLRKNWSLGASIRQGHELVTKGPYSRVRHPMYSSMILVVLGSGLLISNYLIATSTVLVTIVYLVRAKKEEALMAEAFPEYLEYASKTKLFIPGIF